MDTDNNGKYSGKFIFARKQKNISENPDTFEEPEEEEQLSKVQKGIVYLLTRIILAVIIIVLVWLGFNIGLNSMNVYTLAKDALVLRTTYALQPDKVEEGKLNNYFTVKCQGHDEVLANKPYENYEISNYYDRIIIDPEVIWPWQETAEVTAVEQVMDIAGKYTEAHLADLGKTEEEMKEEKVVIPEWKNGEYRLSYIKAKEDGVWKIDEITFVSEAPDRMMKESTDDGTKSQDILLSKGGTVNQVD